MGNPMKVFYNELDSLYQSGNMSAVEGFLQEQARVNNPSTFDGIEYYIAAMSELGAFYRDRSRFLDSVNAFNTASERIAQFKGAESMEYAINISNLAGTYRLMGNYQNSLELFLKALEIFTKTIGRKNYYYASALNNVGLLYQSQGDLQKAQINMAASLEIIESLEDKANYTDEIATSYINLAVMYLSNNELVQSKESIEKALAIFKSMPTPGQHYAAALNCLAGIQFRQNDFQEAAQNYLLALSLVKNTFSENVDFGVICGSIAATFERLGDLPKAGEYALKAQQVIEKCFGDTHERAINARNEAERIAKLIT